MDFLERQRAARGTSVRLVLLFVLAVVSIVAINDLVVFIIFNGEPAGTIIGWIILVSIVTLLIIGCGTASKMIALRAGGAAVAQSVGATAIDPSTRDPRLRRFINIVEEMSIASGVPVPRLFVLEQEPGINAFAAGYSPTDAAITVTSGALDTLNRDELQGVIGHEFSHVLNGDMRLNVRLIGLLNGILLLGLVGLRFLQFGGRSRDRAGAAILAVAIAMIVLGFVGQFFAGLIQAAVGRQREWLADASSVQFTRQTSGLVGALKKIAGLPVGSTLSDKRGAKQVSHMLFGEGSGRLSSLYATHPPLEERIAALDPTVTPEQLAVLMHEYAQHSPDGMAEDAAMGLVGPGETGPRGLAIAPSAAMPVDPATVASRVGVLTADDLARGVALSQRIPAEYRALASEQSNAVPLVLALLVDSRAEIRERQLEVVAGRLGGRTAETVAGLVERLEHLDAVLRLPVVSLAVPVLIARPQPERAAVSAAMDELARADSSITVFEYCLTRLVGAYLRDADAPSRRSRPGRASVTGMQDAALNLLAAVAAAGNADPAAGERAFRAGLARLLPEATTAFVPPAEPWRTLDAGWDALDSLDPRNKRVLIEALVAAVCDDGMLVPDEAELLRATCALLHCPLPPLIG